MAMPEKAQIIQVPNTLRAKVGGRLGALDAQAVAKAEAALADLSNHFEDWLMDEIRKLEEVQRSKEHTSELQSDVCSFDLEPASFIVV